jgi:ABC-type uncharacterized transport system permease subunit
MLARHRYIRQLLFALRSSVMVRSVEALGTLDYILIKPANSQFMISVRHVQGVIAEQ